MFKFVHAADIHLDSPLRGLDRYEGAPVDRVRSSTRKALEAMVDLAIEEAAAFVLLSGDVFDGDWRDYKTGLYFIDQMSKLGRAGVRVFMLRGNHDAANRSMKRLALPDNVYEFGSRRPETERLDDLGVVLHGQSFPAGAVTMDLAAGYPDAVPGMFNIGLLHTSLNGRPGHDTYAPCTTDSLTARGYDYWALGHVHEREVVRENPLIVFPGNTALGKGLLDRGTGRHIDFRRTVTELQNLDLHVNLRFVGFEVRESHCGTAFEALITKNLGKLRGLFYCTPETLASPASISFRWMALINTQDLRPRPNSRPLSTSARRRQHGNRFHEPTGVVSQKEPPCTRSCVVTSKPSLMRVVDASTPAAAIPPSSKMNFCAI